MIKTSKELLYLGAIIFLSFVTGACESSQPPSETSITTKRLVEAQNPTITKNPTTNVLFEESPTEAEKPLPQKLLLDSPLTTLENQPFQLTTQHPDHTFVLGGCNSFSNPYSRYYLEKLQDLVNRQLSSHQTHLIWVSLKQEHEKILKSLRKELQIPAHIVIFNNELLEKLKWSFISKGNCGIAIIHQQNFIITKVFPTDGNISRLEFWKWSSHGLPHLAENE